ncbi:alpha/beta hydrolase [Roseomonas sp. KE0001]|nr:alpha/beta hydrolase-fold protein [Roseomonas sp. KE0001]MBI0434477.1 alpha/beta hydrolase [Roseomonas sp. KE0001]
MAARRSVADGLVTLPGTAILPAQGASGAYRLLTAIPEGPPPPGGFPVVWLLDANACFGMALEILRHGMLRQKTTRIAPAILVGIAYPGEGLFDRRRRSLDYTAAAPAGEPHPGPHGGRDAFRDFLRDVAKPLLAAHAPADPGRQAVIGHSLAGYLTLDLLAWDSALFQGYGAISPSVWWDRERLLRGLAAASPAQSPPVYIGVGEWEQRLAPWEEHGPDSAGIAARRTRRGMVEGAREMAAAIRRALPASRTGFEVLPGENHASMLPIGISHALRALLAPEALGGAG